MSLDILLSEMNEGEMELLAAELVTRLSGVQSAPRSEPEISDSAPPPSPRKASETESDPAVLRSHTAAEASPEPHSESRAPSPALKQILFAMKSWDIESTPDSNPASNEPIYNTDFPDRAQRQDGSLNESQNYQAFSDTSHPTELSFIKVPNNVNLTVTEEPDSAEKSEAAFSDRGDTVPAFRSGMERVSDFFMRDSRRYDSGFERF